MYICTLRSGGTRCLRFWKHHQSVLGTLGFYEELFTGFCSAGRWWPEAFYINTELDDERREGMDSTCRQLNLVTWSRDEH